MVAKGGSKRFDPFMDPGFPKLFDCCFEVRCGRSMNIQCQVDLRAIFFMHYFDYKWC